jgi:hypothetical protein
VIWPPCRKADSGPPTRLFCSPQPKLWLSLARKLLARLGRTIRRYSPQTHNVRTLRFQKSFKVGR